jgi:hypothetical protein
MKRQIALLMMALSLPACQRTPMPPAESYRSVTDQWIVRLGLPTIGIWPCRDRHKKTGGTKVHVPLEEGCYKMEPSQQWRGVWATEFEAHRFCPGAAESCPWDNRNLYELWWNTRVFTDRPQIGAQLGRRYELAFVGRRTKYRVGTWSPHYEIVVDRLVSMRDLGPMPKK